MVTEVHGVSGCDMDHFIRECVYLFHNKLLFIFLFIFDFLGSMLILFFSVF
jgi:hypothetical protein